MSPPRQNPPAEPSLATHEDILARESRNTVLRRRWRVFWSVTAVALTLAVGFGARPALHLVKAWQARRLAAQAMRQMDEGKWFDARRTVSDAFQIWQAEPAAVRAMASFLNRTGNFRQALPFWENLVTLHATTGQDRRDTAAAELALGDLDAAEAQLRLAWPAGQPGTPADWLLGMQLALRRDHGAEAATLARRLIADPATAERTRLSAAGVLLSVDTSAEAQALGRQVFETVAAGGKSAASLEALTTLARWASSIPANVTTPPDLPPLPELIARLEAHPLATLAQHLYVLDLRATLEPARRAEFIQGAIDRYGGSRDDANLATLTAWVYGKGEFDQTLALLPPERANGDHALFLQRMDALAALGRWRDIRAEIQAGKFPLEPMLAQMYLARCADQLGEPKVRDACWEAALAAAAADTNKLLTVGQYAQKNGAAAIAARAFQAAVTATPDSREANTALLRLLQATGQTRALREAIAAFSAHAKGDRSVSNDLAYLDALLNVNVPAARDTARRLVQAEPGSVPHRATLALAELRLGNGFAALDAFKNLPLPNLSVLSARQRAVYAAALWQTSYVHEAHELAASILLEELLPEERELIAPILAVAAP